ncbi:hypothetical protein [uncultured Microbacterium sp.]|uniref:hypothetical protein n=1 Tax=uncultured Microbacterium sp. TaxID=191216 RepID=UPI0028DC227F|nr:hypothetical protein [uncultured Microbacterium sp.]
MGGRRWIAAPVAIVVVATLAACAPAVPETVVQGTEITAGWTGELTSLNAAAAPTPGNIDIAQAVRADFGDVVDGEFVPDEGFGTVSIVSEDPFTVRYDLAEPVWSDGIPLDAADLLLGWAGAAGEFAPDDAVVASDPAAPEVTKVDEFARSIEVTYAQPVIDWQQRVTVPVPAHIVGQRGLDIDDPMEAKQAVIRAVQSGDAGDLASLAKIWNDGFIVDDSSDLSADLLLSSGPFRIEKVGDEGDSVTLVPNGEFRGPVTPQVARIELTPPGDDPVAAIGDTLDVAQMRPTAENREPIRELERQDYTVDTSHDGTVWAVLVNPVGAFTQQPARTAFFHSIPASALIAGGAGEWAQSYTGTTSMLSAPGSRAYDIVNEDSGFADSIGSPNGDAGAERELSGVAAGAPVCVLYDRTSAFAAGVFAAMAQSAGEARWSIQDCGTDDLDAALDAGQWDAAIVREAIPQSPAQILARWGTSGKAAAIGATDPARDELVSQLARTADVYEGREVLAQIEASIVRMAVAMPLAVNPRLTIVDKDVTGIGPRTGAIAPLTSSIVQWAVVPK